MSLRDRMMVNTAGAPYVINSVDRQDGNGRRRLLATVSKEKNEGYR